MARQERADLADLLAGLSPEEWERQSLCTGWTVRDVVAHVVSYEELDGRDRWAALAETRFVPTRLNEVTKRRYDNWPPDRLLAFLREHLVPRGATARLGGRVGLVDAMIHQQDIRRPLGREREVPVDRLRVALPFAVWAPPLRGAWRTRGVRLVATDVDFAWGRGPEVRGPGEAVLMALAGRAAAAADLTGPGAELLANRLG